ncbi:FT-interacting protein 1, partial [Mucuna pruriens]
MTKFAKSKKQQESRKKMKAKEYEPVSPTELRSLEIFEKTAEGILTMASYTPSGRLSCSLSLSVSFISNSDILSFPITHNKQIFITALHHFIHQEKGNVPGHSNKKVTVASLSSALTVMISSLPAQRSISAMILRLMGIEMERSHRKCSKASGWRRIDTAAKRLGSLACREKPLLEQSKFTCCTRSLMASTTFFRTEPSTRRKLKKLITDLRKAGGGLQAYATLFMYSRLERILFEALSTIPDVDTSPMGDEEVNSNLKVISPKSVRDDGGGANLVKINRLLFERARDMVGHCDPYVEVKFGRFKGTLCLRTSSGPEENIGIGTRSEETFPQLWHLNLDATSIEILIQATLGNLTFTSNLENTKLNEDILIARSHNRLDSSSASTKTIVSLDGGYHEFDEDPQWNVYDSCTFITNFLFDNGQFHKGDVVATGAINTRKGKVRINRIYCYSNWLVELDPWGMKRMGEIQLAFKFCKVYTLHMLPRTSSPTEFHGLRKQLVMLVSSKMSKTEALQTRDVVEYMLDCGEMWSMQRDRSDFERSELVAYPQLDEICKWISPISTLAMCLVLLFIIVYPQYLLPAMFSCHFLRHQSKPSRLDELEGIIRNMYNRFRVAAGKYAKLLGDFATKGERYQFLFIWQDPIATMLVIVLCLITGILTFIVPFQDIVSVWLLYLLRHPILRSSVPTLHQNRTRSMPSKLDIMIYQSVISIYFHTTNKFEALIQSQTVTVFCDKFIHIYNNYFQTHHTYDDYDDF